MRRIRRITIILIAMSLLLVGASVFLPASPGSKSTHDFAALAAVALALSSFAIIAAILFMLGLKSFKDEFRKTYYFVCAGLITQALALLVYPTAIYLGILGTGFTSYGGDLFYTIGAISIFIGLWNFARLLKLSNLLTKLWFVGGVTLLVTIGLWGLPHSPLDAPELYFDLTRGIVAFEATLSLISVWVLWSIRRHASLLYARPIMWLMGALFFNSVGEWFYFTANHILTPEGAPDSDLTSVSGIFFLVSRVFYIVAGYSLIKMTQAETRQEKAAPIDAIVYMATLVSRPADIDPLLDQLRAITATLPADRRLTPIQNEALHKLYAQLEEYLITKEPLLKFSRESLRAKLEHKFGTLPFGTPTKEQVAGATTSI